MLNTDFNPVLKSQIAAAAGARPVSKSEGLLLKKNRSPSGAASGSGTAGSSRPNTNQYVGPTIAPVIGEKLSEITKSIDPSFELTPEAEEVLLALTDTFVDSVVSDR